MLERFAVRTRAVSLGALSLLLTVAATASPVRTRVRNTPPARPRVMKAQPVRLPQVRPPAAPAPAITRANPKQPASYSRPGTAVLPKRKPRTFVPAAVPIHLPDGHKIKILSPANFGHDFPQAPLVTQLTGGTGIATEPCFISDSSAFLYASGGPSNKDGTGGRYPSAAADTDEQKAMKEPAYLNGPDFVVVSNSDGYSRSGSFNFGVRGEFFEPSISRSRDPRGLNENFRLAFSGYLPGDNDIYKYVGDSGLTADEPGPACRVISYSDNAMTPGSTPAITRTLQPAIYGQGQREIPPETEGGDPTTKKFVIYSPDATPAVYPGNPRFIFFVSLRSGGTQTSLWMWDTAKDAGSRDEVRQVLSIPGMSILHPRFSPDGKYLAFTVCDLKFNPVDFVAGNGTDLTGTKVPQDFVYSLDCLPVTDPASPIQTKFKSYVAVSPFQFGQQWSFSNTADLGVFLSPDRATLFDIPDPADEKKRLASRDWMPFWSETNQLGFSSDRQDVQGSGYADTVNPDPKAANFSIYTFPKPYSPPSFLAPAYEDQGTPDLMPSHQALADLASDTSNELLSAWVPLEPGLTYWYGNTDGWNFLGNNTLALTAPRLLISSDADPATPTAPGPATNLWALDKTVPTTFKGDVLADLPTIAFDGSGTKEGTPGGVATITATINESVIPKDLTNNPLPYKVYAVVKDPDDRLFKVAQTVWGVKTRDIKLTEVDPGVVTTIFRELNTQTVSYSAASVKDYADKYPVADPPDPNRPQIGGIVELTPTEANPTVRSGRWYSPLDASDYIIDIIVAPETPSLEWSTPYCSDNIQGCTTAPFVPYSPVLMVSDFAQGQQTVPYTTLAPTTAGVPTESYFTERPHPEWAYAPGAATDSRPVMTQGAWVGIGPRVEFQSGAVVDDPTKVIPVDPTDPTSTELHRSTLDFSVPPALSNQPLTTAGLSGPYDLWRTQCRLPITMNVLKDYIPYVQQQVGFPNTEVTRPQRVADRSVFWFAPHCGQVDGSAGLHAQGFGTLANPATQSEVVKFLNRGGRMLLAGDDVAFTLAQNIPNNPNAVLNFFKVKFESGKATDVDTFVYEFFRAEMSATQPDNQQGLNPIPYVAWPPTNYHFGIEPTPTAPNLAPFFSYPKGLYLTDVNLPLYEEPVNNLHNTHEDGASTNLFIDSITVRAGDPTAWNTWSGTPVYTFNDGKTATVQTEAPLLLLGDAADRNQENTSRSKTLFFSFGLEGVNRDYRAATADNDMGTDHFHAQNTLAEILHNAVDFFNTGSIVGYCYLNNSTTPLDGVIVRAFDDYRARSKGFLKGTTTSGPTTLYPGMPSGAYRIEGMDASVYKLDAYKTGFVFVNTAEAYVYGGLDSPLTNLYLIPVPPGKLTGTVTDANDPTKVVAGATVHIQAIDKAVDLTGTTDANGKYSFEIVQAGLYNIEVSATDYNNFTTTDPVLVNQGPAVTNYDVQLTPATPPPPPAIISGTVKDGDGNGISGATVTLLDQDGNSVVPRDGGMNPVTTAADGAYSFSVNEGTYNVKAEVAGFPEQTKPATGTSGQTTTVNFVFTTAPLPTVLTGTISNDQSAPIQGATVTLQDADGNPVTLEGQNPATTGADGKYTFTLTDAGSYKVKVEAATFDTQTKDVVVALHDTTTLDFTMVPTPVNGSLEGTVTDAADSTLISGATVRVRTADSTIDKTVTTGADGRYQVTDLPAGPYLVDVTAAGYDSYASPEPVVVAAGPAVTTLDVQLTKTPVIPPSGTLQVTVVNAANTPSVPFPNASVAVLDQGTNQPVTTVDGGPNPATTSGSGIATFKLTPGTYNVKVTVPVYAAQTKTITVAQDQTASLSFTFGSPLHVFTSGKVLLASTPYDYTGSDISTVLSIGTQGLNKAIVAFDASQNFVFYPTFPADTFHIGRGYGLKLPSNGTVRSQGTAASVGTDNYFVMQLSPGWNLIGDPFNATIPWDDSDAAVKIRVAYGGTVGTKSFKLSEALASGYIQSPLWGGYNDIQGVYKNGYQTVNALVPWEARWVKASQPIMLAFPKPAGAGTSMASVNSVAAMHTPLMPAVDVFGLNITAKVGTISDDDLALGLANRATPSVDAGLDFSKPNPMDTAASYVYSSFANIPAAFASDVRPNTGDQAWQFKVHTNVGRQPASLTWSAVGNLPAGATLILFDPSGNTRTDMTKVTRYDYRTAPYGETRTFRVELRRPRTPGRL